MTEKKKTAITPTREEDYSEWYQQVIKESTLAEHAPVRGCMVIKPWGYAIWENIQKILDVKFKATGHENAYFPLFIPLSYFEKEAEHVEGFAKECAVVTHHGLEKNSEGKLVPRGELEEPLVVRPTSEMIIGEMFSRWIQSYRDLPILINQWANIVRWEMRTRLFLRTMEFLWQEGHTAHATKEEAVEETLRMLNVYQEFIEKVLAIPVIKGKKTETERFPGADETYSLELMMQDKKALQGCTSHFLGQNFAKAANIRFFDKDETMKHVWTTSWGATTRLIGAVVMSHSDDDGLILPPRIAPSHIVIIPIIHKEETKADVLSYCHALAGKLRHLRYHDRTLDVVVDERDMRGGDKMWGWVKKGIPLRIEVGPRDIATNSVCVYRRDKEVKDKTFVAQEEFLSNVMVLLDEIQDGLFKKALSFQKENTVKIDSKEAFYEFFTPKNKERPEIHGGFALAHWCGERSVEEKLKEDLSVTIRTIPLDMEQEEGICPFTGKKSLGRVVFAKSY